MSKFNVIDSLYLIWGYSRNYTFNYDFPNDIEKPSGFNPNNPDKFERQYRGGLHYYELEFLQKEFILNCDITKTKYSIREQKYFIKTINYLRNDIENTLSKLYTNQENIFLEFNRVAHRQSKWQHGYDLETIFRYYQIYSDPTLSEIIHNRFNLTTDQLFQIGIIFFSCTAKNFRTPLPMKSEVKALNSEMFEIFLSHFSMTVEDARRELRQFQQINENLFYSYNPILAKPILIDNSSAICPIPLFIYWQITSGIYYFIYNEKNFDNAFGNSFQKYVGEVLKKSCDSHSIAIFPEEKYGKPEKATSDWLIIDQTSIMFIECKTKRMRLDSKSELEVKDNLEIDLKKMADFIGQLYKTYIDYCSDLYPTIKYDETKDFYPLVLTLEEWHININPILCNKLKEFVIDYLNKNGLDLALLEKFPYHIYCASEFENHIQLINALGIRQYFHKTQNNLIQDYTNTFKFKDIYEGEFEKIFTDPFTDK